MAESTEKRLRIVGCGPGMPDYLTGAARRAIVDADMLVGAPHLLDLYAKPGQEQIPVKTDIPGVLAAIDERLNRTPGNLTVLVSGDPGLCSLARPVIEWFGRDACDVIPGISSIQLAFARLGLDWRDVRIVNAHSDIPRMPPSDLENAGSIVILAGHKQAQSWIGNLLSALKDQRRMVVCQDLSLTTECIEEISPERFKEMSLSSRTLVVLLKETSS